MDSFVMTDWLTILGNDGSIVQPASGWLELDHDGQEREDVSFFLEVKQASNVSMSYETSPNALQESQFVAIVAPFAMSTGVRVDVASADSVAVPAAGLLRWRLTSSGGGSFSATFRLAVAAHAYGGG